MSEHEQLWWDATHARYYAWNGQGGAEPGEHLKLVGLDGSERSVDIAGAQEVTEAQVVAVLAPIVRTAIDAMTTTLAALDPSFAGLEPLDDLGARGPTLDVQGAVERLVTRLAATPEATTEALAAMIDHIAVLRMVLSFGKVARPLLESLGLGASQSTPASEAESADAMVTRVRADVRAELDAQASTRAPMSFDFQELVRGGR